ncbi:MAG: sulfite exporter TauE/SafE family protein [Candidatus Zixiibacteriota bacterium]|nr:MAG: sulfite exporter TauE/SafE family protein [candidate division Zixibacteria bacterium]
MDSFLVGAASAVWLGILTSISPCPLATNIAAVSYLSKQVASPRLVFASGLAYVTGRMLAYLVLGVILVASLLSIPDLSHALQKHINTVLGPILVVVGIFLLGFLPISFSGFALSDRSQKRLAGYGAWGAGLCGIVFALSFCPVSAALFFGSLVPLSVTHNSKFFFPLVYGLGTGLPVVVVAILIASGANYIGSFLGRLAKFELWARRLTGGIFIVVGLYYCLIYFFEIDI